MREDCSERRLPRYSSIDLPVERYIPGQTPRPVGSIVDTYSNSCRSGFTRSIVFCYGVDLFNRGFYWEAHEAWEHLWIPCKEQPEGLFLKGLIQLTASLVKRIQKNYYGESLLRERGLRHLAESNLASFVFSTDILSENFFAGELLLEMKE